MEDFDRLFSLVVAVRRSRENPLLLGHNGRLEKPQPKNGRATRRCLVRRTTGLGIATLPRCGGQNKSASSPIMRILKSLSSDSHGSKNDFSSGGGLANSTWGSDALPSTNEPAAYGLRLARPFGAQDRLASSPAGCRILVLQGPCRPLTARRRAPCSCRRQARPRRPASDCPPAAGARPPCDRRKRTNFRLPRKPRPKVPAASTTDKATKRQKTLVVIGRVLGQGGKKQRQAGQYEPPLFRTFPDFATPAESIAETW